MVKTHGEVRQEMIGLVAANFYDKSRISISCLVGEEGTYLATYGMSSKTISEREIIDLGREHGWI